MTDSKASATCARIWPKRSRPIRASPKAGLRVAVDGDELVVTGSVSTEARRQGVAAVAAEVAAPFRVRNETQVVAIAEPDGEVVRE